MNLRDWIDSIRRPKPRIEIQTEWGLVTESARLAAAHNMILHPEIRERCERAMCRQMGSLERGMAEMRRRYPEAYQFEVH